MHDPLDMAAPSFDPTKPPAGRLARLGVVLDGRTSPGQVAPVAGMCARAGIDAIWLAGALAGTPLQGEFDPWAEAGAVAADIHGTTLGVLVNASDARPAAVGDLLEGRIEIALAGVGSDQTTPVAIRAALGGVAIRLSAVARSSDDVGPLLGTVDDVVLSAWNWPALESAADAWRAAAAALGRDPATLGVAALLPVSVGWTVAEASARAEMDPTFARFGHPSDIGIFGTLEECQDRVIALAHAGITDLRCVLPATPDVHDVIAQLTAITIGTTDVLVPGSLRSPSPPPPDGWGGRPHRAPMPQTSSGSRRRV